MSPRSRISILESGRVRLRDELLSTDEQKLPGTTVMIRSLPHSMDRHGLETLFAQEGFGLAYDFVYLPADLKLGGCFGYGFVNLVNPFQAQRFMDHFEGFSFPPQEQPCVGVHTSEAIQGLDQLIERYRNSPLMHRSVPDIFKPTLYEDGVPVVFPHPTEKLRPPRHRTTQSRRGSAKKACLQSSGENLVDRFCVNTATNKFSL